MDDDGDKDIMVAPNSELLVTDLGQHRVIVFSADGDTLLQSCQWSMYDELKLKASRVPVPHWQACHPCAQAGRLQPVCARP